MTTTDAHPNDMTRWPAIHCLRNCATHATRVVQVTLGGPTPYTDLPPIPERFRDSFGIEVWDTDAHPVDGGPYCPAHDAVSETIATLGVWEPTETIVALDLLDSRRPGGFIDVGAQLGWFSVLAALWGNRPVLAVEADADNHALLRGNLAKAGTRGATFEWRVGSKPAPSELPESARLVKIDVEGAEPEAVEWLWPVVDGIDAFLVELSPTFHGGYIDLALRLVDAGFSAYPLPEKGAGRDLASEPGRLLDDLENYGGGPILRPSVPGWVVSKPQQNALFIRPERY